MKKLLSILILSGFFVACNEANTTPSAVNEGASQTVESGALTTIQWIDSTKDLGRINEGQKVEVSFRFRNSGEKPLVIQSVRPGCGCTVADFPKEPIAPGAEGKITGSFDSKGREGLQHKEIYVSANTIGSTDHRISFQVDVKPNN